MVGVEFLFTADATRRVPSGSWPSVGDAAHRALRCDATRRRPGNEVLHLVGRGTSSDPSRPLSGNMKTEQSLIRPGLAIIANCMTPYRAHLHTLIAAGIPELKLHTLITHGAAAFDWTVEVPPTIHASSFAAPDDSPLAGSFAAPLREWQKGGRLIRYLELNDVRAVILNGYRYLSNWRVINRCHRAGIPLFVRNDSNILCERNLPSWKQWLKTRVYRAWIPRTAGIMSMGELGDQFFRKYGAVPERLYRVPVWPDYDRYSEIDQDRLEGFCRKFHLRDDRRYLLYSGRLVPKKRVDLLIDAFAAIAGQRANWDLLIVGDGPLREQLRERIPKSIQPRVVWTGFVQQNECISAYHAADALVLPSDQEPWALVVQEAMAAGIPVIASDAVGAAREMVKDRESGRIFPAGNLAALQQAILDVTDSDLIGRYRERATASLAEYRRQIDPVSEIRRALTDVGLLKS